MSKKLFASVVLYHPDSDVFNNFLTYVNYVDELLLIDNSENFTAIPEFVLNNKRINIIRNGCNKGIARALNTGAKVAIEKGYHWMLTMDQDSYFDETEAAKYFNYFSDTHIDRLGILSPSQLSVSIDSSGPIIVMTSGNIINLSCYEDVNGFRDELFIDEVDHDYCLKVILANYVIKQVPIKMNHSLGKHKTISAFGKKLVVSTHSPVRLYYIVRNNLFMFRTYGQTFPDLIKERKKMLIRVVFNNIVFDPKLLIKKIYMIKKAISDFKKDRYGQYKQA